MNLEKYANAVQETVVEPMISYMEEMKEELDGEPFSYTLKDVEKCRKLITDYLNGLAALTAPTDAAIMKLVKKLVVSLNKLNEKTDFELLETDARESICEIIQESAVECGLQNADDDITEEWREW